MESPSVFISSIFSWKWIIEFLKGSRTPLKRQFVKKLIGDVFCSPKGFERFEKGGFKAILAAPRIVDFCGSQFLILNISSNLNPKSKSL
jgi:hypothetical protein